MKSFFLFLSALILTGSVFAQTNPPVLPTAPAVQPPPALVWPVPIALGQRWVLTLDSLGQWDILLSARDKDGDAIGTAKALTEKTSDYQVFFYYAKKDDVINLYLSAKNGTGLLCQFSKTSVSNLVSDVTMIGAAYKKEVGKPFEKLDTTCLASWVNSPNAPLSIQPVGTVALPPTTTTPPVVTPAVVTAPPVVSPTNGTATDAKPPTNALALVWSPKIEVGQTWVARVGNLTFDIALQRLAAGVARGTAKRGTVSGDAFMFYNSGENRMTLELSLGSDQFVCSFDLKGAADKAYTGTAIYRSGSSVAQTLKEQCVLFRTK